MTDTAYIYTVIVILVVFFTLIVWWQNDWIERLRDANEAFDDDLSDTELQLREHSQLLGELDRARKRMETLPARMNALEQRDRILSGREEGDDVVYVTG